MRRLLITGASGFIGSHLLDLLTASKERDSEVNIQTVLRSEVDLLNPSADQILLDRFQPTHVLHLAWSSTLGDTYDSGTVHKVWAYRTFSLIEGLSKSGVVNWCVGTGLENENRSTKPSAYRDSKLQLKQAILSLGDPHCRWITMPYVFSLLHQRPRILKSCLEGDAPLLPDAEEDYLEIRDVAFQLKNILYDNVASVTSVSGRGMIKNSMLCKQVQAKKDDKKITSCSCQAGYVHIPTESDTHFTSHFFEKSE